MFARAEGGFCLCLQGVWSTRREAHSGEEMLVGIGIPFARVLASAGIQAP